MDSIENILIDFHNGVMNIEAAERRLGVMFQEQEVRDAYICAMLQGGVAGRGEAQSDIVASYVWDVAQRLMNKRARNVPIIETPPEDQVARMIQSQAYADALKEGYAAVAGQPFPKTGANLPHVPPYGDAITPKTWGGGEVYADKVQENQPDSDGPEVPGEHDDGPF